MQYIEETIYIQTTTNRCIVKLPHRKADTDKFNWAYDYNHYIAKDNNYYDDRNLN
jgi:hypothetical protein